MTDIKRHSGIRILYLSHTWPHAKSSGTQLRVLHIARTLQALGSVAFSVVYHDAPEAEVVNRTEEEFGTEVSAPLVWVRRRSWAERSRRLLQPRYLNLHDHCVAEPGRSRILAIMSRYDIVWITQLLTANLFQVWKWPRSVMDIDDLPSTAHEASRRTARGIVEKMREVCWAAIARRRERHLAERFTVLGVCSEADRKRLTRGVPVFVIPNGFAAASSEAPRSRAYTARVGFIGSLYYEPNEDAVKWFANLVWPLIKKEEGACRLRLIGQGTAEAATKLGADIDGLGWLPECDSEISTWTAMIVPVRRGAGTRVKIAEAFSKKCPVVSTSQGCYGYDVRDGCELLIADSPREFAAACLMLLRNPTVGDGLVVRAWQKFKEQLSWDAIRPRVLDAAEACLRLGRCTEAR